MELTDEESRIIDAINNALGDHKNYFEIKPNEILVDDEESYAQYFTFTFIKQNGFILKENIPKIKIEFTIFIPNTCFEEINITVNEDAEIKISFGNLYAVLFWDLVCE